MKTVLEVIYDDLTSSVYRVLDWHDNGDNLFFREGCAPNRTTFIPICAIKSYSIENVPTLGIGGRGLPIETQL